MQVAPVSEFREPSNIHNLCSVNTRLEFLFEAGIHVFGGNFPARSENALTRSEQFF